MGRFAKVGSVDTLRELRSNLCTFAHIASTSLEEAGSDIQRTLMWLKQDRSRYWKVELRNRSEQFVRAKLELKRKQDIETSPMGGTYSFIDEKKALAVAQRALEEAEQKLQNIQRWIPQLEREAYAFRGISQGLMDLVDVQVPNSCALLDRMIDSLEAYLALAPEAAGPIAGTESYADSAVPSEAVSSMSRSIDSMKTKPEMDFQKLRDKTPVPEIRGQIPWGEVECQWLGKGKIDAQMFTDTVSSDMKREPVLADDTVIIADFGGEVSGIFLERCAVGGVGDSGWYIGIIDDVKTEKNIAVRIADLLHQCPELEEILTLPVGYLVVIEADAVRAIVDPQNRIINQAETQKEL
jgi:hypothetical protein